MKPIDGRSVVTSYLWSDFCRVGFGGRFFDRFLKIKTEGTLRFWDAYLKPNDRGSRS